MLLTACYVGTYGLCVAIPDSTRDVYIAYGISTGKHFPLEGPVLGGAMHGGPVWFYLLALPLLVSRSWLAVTLFAGVLAGMKYTLAYVCGSRLVDRRFGLIWSLVLAIPGWSTVEQVAFTNANVAETCVLATLYFALRLRRHPSLGSACVLGLASGLAFHAHPTTVLVVPLAFAVAMFVLREERMQGALAFLAGCAAPFVPYLVSQALSGFPDWATATGYVATQVRAAQLANAGAILRSVAFDGPIEIARYLIGVDPALLPLVSGLLAALLVAAAVGLVMVARQAVGRRRVGSALAIVVIFVLAIACLRPTTPVYFAYALLPPFAAAVALGLHGILERTRGGAAIAGLAITVLALQALVVAKLYSAVTAGRGTLPEVGDISSKKSMEPSTNVWFPAYAHAASGTFLCRSGDSAAVHGPLAFLVDMNLGVDTLLRCDRQPAVQLSGAGAAERTHWVGMPVSFWEMVSVRPQCRLGPLGLAPAAQALWPPGAIAPVSADKFLPRPFLHGASQERSLAFTTAAAAVVLTNVIPWYMPWRIASVRVDGREVAPRESTVASALYAAPDHGVESARWEVRFSAPSPEMIDIAAIGPSAAAKERAPECADRD